MEFQGCCHLPRTISWEPRKLSLAVSFDLGITLRLVSYFHFKTASIEYLAFPGTLLFYCHPFGQQLQIAKVSEILRQFACENRDHCRKALFSYRWVGLHRQCLSPIAKMERKQWVSFIINTNWAFFHTLRTVSWLINDSWTSSKRIPPYWEESFSSSKSPSPSRIFKGGLNMYLPSRVTSIFRLLTSASVRNHYRNKYNTSLK